MYNLINIVLISLKGKDSHLCLKTFRKTQLGSTMDRWDYRVLLWIPTAGVGSMVRGIGGEPAVKERFLRKNGIDSVGDSELGCNQVLLLHGNQLSFTQRESVNFSVLYNTVLDQQVSKLIPLRARKSLLSLEGHAVSVATIQLCHSSMKTTTDTKETNECGFVPTEHYLQQ